MAAPFPPCPVSGTAGLKVYRKTLGAALQPKARPKIPDGDLFYFCPEPACEWVYYLPDRPLFQKGDLRAECIGLKCGDPCGILCFCFGFTREAIQEDIRRNGKTEIPEFIAREVKRGNCYCEITNPKGACCLGDIQTAIRQAKRGRV